METLGQRIRELRLQKGMTQAELAEGIVSVSMMSQIENDKANPSGYVLGKLAARLGTSPNVLLSGVEGENLYKAYKMAEASMHSKRYEDAIPIFAGILDDLKSHHDVLKEQVCYDLGICYLETNSFDEAIRMLCQAEQETERDDTRFRSCIHLALARAFRCKGNYLQAHYNAQKALDIYQGENLELHDPLHLAKLLFELAMIYQPINSVEHEKYLTLAFAQYEKCGDVQQLSDIYRQLSLDAYDAKQYTQALVYVGRFLSYDALRCMEYGRLEEALECQRLQVMFERQQHHYWESITKLSDIATIFLENNEADNAHVYAQSGFAHIEPEDHFLKGRANSIFAGIALANGQEEHGRNCIEKAILLFKDHERLADLDDTARQLCERLAKAGLFQDAYENLLESHAFIVDKLVQRGGVL